jgi:uncharacterized protein (TIGR03382 family)
MFLRQSPAGTRGLRGSGTVVAFAAWAAAWSWPGLLAAQSPPEPVDWTAILFMDGSYDNMEEKLSWTGSSARVHVLVLHQGWDGLRAYRMEPDTDLAHPPGECCPGEIQPCCASTDLSLGVMGLSSSSWITDAGTISTFLAWVAENYPARQYLMSFRGSLDFSGLTAPGMVAELEEFVSVHRGGERIEVLNLGYCLSGSVRWAYDLRHLADYLFGSGNWTNAPVAARWRFYIWVRQLIKDPTTTPEAVAAAMPDVFAETTQTCIDDGHDCENPGEPWAVGAWRLEAFDDLARELHALNCGLLGAFADNEAEIDDAMEDAAVYGYGLGDFYCYLHGLRTRLSDTTLIAAADSVQGVLDGARVHSRQEEAPYFTCAEVAGLNIAMDSWDPYAEGGAFALDSGWAMLVEATQGGSSAATVAEVRVEPERLTVPAGGLATVEAFALDQNGAVLCFADVDWVTAGIAHIGALTSLDNPTTFEAAVPGVGVLRARVGEQMGETRVTVLERDGTPPPTVYHPTPVEQGCNCAAGSSASAWLMLLTAALRRRRSYLHPTSSVPHGSQ